MSDSDAVSVPVMCYEQYSAQIRAGWFVYEPTSSKDFRFILPWLDVELTLSLIALHRAIDYGVSLVASADYALMTCDEVADRLRLQRGGVDVTVPLAVIRSFIDAVVEKQVQLLAEETLRFLRFHWG